MPINFLSMPGYQPAPGLNFEPMANALSDYTATQIKRRSMDLEDQRFGLERDRFGLQKRDSDLAYGNHLASKQAYDNFLSQPPEWTRRSPEVMDAIRIGGYDRAPQTIMSGKNADIERQKAQTQAALTHAQIAQMKNQTPEARARIAPTYGMQPGTAEYNAFVLNGQYAPPESKFVHFKAGETGGFVDPRTQSFKPVNGSGDSTQAAFDAKFAEKAPEFYVKAQADYAAANDAHQTASDMERLVPHIYSGTWSGIQTETAKLLNSRLGANFSKVAPTELFRSLAQKFVGQEGHKYKPLSNLDITFIERGLPNIQKDPTSIPHIVGAMKTVAAREQLAKQLELQVLRTGKPPDPAAIQKIVDEQIPSYVTSMFPDAGVQTANPARPPVGSAPPKTPPQGWSIERVK